MKMANLLSRLKKKAFEAEVSRLAARSSQLAGAGEDGGGGTGTQPRRPGCRRCHGLPLRGHHLRALRRNIPLRRRIPGLRRELQRGRRDLVLLWYALAATQGASDGAFLPARRRQRGVLVALPAPPRQIDVAYDVDDCEM